MGILLEKVSLPKFDKTDYQTLPIILCFTLFLFIYFMAAPQGRTKRQCPDPIVGLGARLIVGRNFIRGSVMTVMCNCENSISRENAYCLSENRANDFQ